MIPAKETLVQIQQVEAGISKLKVIKKPLKKRFFVVIASSYHLIDKQRNDVNQQKYLLVRLVYDKKHKISLKWQMQQGEKQCRR